MQICGFKRNHWAATHRDSSDPDIVCVCFRLLVSPNLTDIIKSGASDNKLNGTLPDEFCVYWEGPRNLYVALVYDHRNCNWITCCTGISATTRSLVCQNSAEIRLQPLPRKLTFSITNWYYLISSYLENVV